MTVAGWALTKSQSLKCLGIEYAGSRKKARTKPQSPFIIYVYMLIPGYLAYHILLCGDFRHICHRTTINSNSQQTRQNKPTETSKSTKPLTHPIQPSKRKQSVGTPVGSKELCNLHSRNSSVKDTKWHHVLLHLRGEHHRPSRCRL